MVVVLKMNTGDTHFLDRRLRTDQVSEKINEARGKGQLVKFEDNRIPTGQVVWIDPDNVVSIRDDGHSY